MTKTRLKTHVNILVHPKSYLTESLKAVETHPDVGPDTSSWAVLTGKTRMLEFELNVFHNCDHSH